MPYPLLGHSLDAAGVALVLSVSWLSGSQRDVLESGTGLQGDQLDRWLSWVAGVHDVGKAIPAFQQLSRPGWEAVPESLVQDTGRAGQLPHYEASHRVILDLLPGLGEISERAVLRVAEILGGHHGVYQAVEALPGGACRVAGMGGPVWDAARAEVLRRVWATCGPAVLPQRVSVPAAVLATGLVVVADWLVSQESWLIEAVGRIQGEGFDPGRWLPQAVAAAPRLVEDAGLLRARFRPAGFAERFGFPARGVQVDVSGELPQLVDGPGLLLVAAPTGEGKTETALHAAALLAERCGSGGVFVALPTMATADEMLHRVLTFAGDNVTGPVTATLLHSMAAFNDRYTGLPDLPPPAGERFGQDPAAVPVLGGDDAGPAGGAGSLVAVTRWLKGSKRGLLASVSVGTVDQVLATALRGRHQALRMLGLTGRVLVVDEAHAYDPYMQELLRRALVWLGATGTPVVLLSATIAARTAARLMDAYREGAGHPPAAGDDGDLAAFTYPGWAWLSGRSGQVHCRPTSPARTVSVLVDLVTYPGTGPEPGPVEGQPGQESQPGRESRPGHVQACLRSVGPVLAGGGNALIVCTTVRQSQDTYQAVRERLDQLPASQRPLVMLLHSRFPLRRRLEITRQLTSLFGKTAGSARPQSAIVVATQVVEQSLDVDFDVVVSHLAPIAMLLQRAGRCHRHPVHGPRRPAGFRAPRLVVVAGTDRTGGLVADPAWTYVYPEATLEATWRVLQARPVQVHPDTGDRGRLVRVPGDVQGLVDQVDRAWEMQTGDDTAFTAAVETWLAQVDADEGLARLGLVGSPATVTALTALTSPHDSDERLGTRLGADQARVLPIYPDALGRWWLDSARTRPVPGADGRAVTTRDAHAVVGACIPVRDSRWTRHARAVTPVPATWADVPWLTDIVLLPITRIVPGPGTGAATGVANVAGHRIRIDPDYGLRQDRIGAPS